MVASVRYMRGEWKLWYAYQVEEKAVVEIACYMEDPSKAFIVPVYLKKRSLVS